MLKIRLQRVGRRNNPAFRVVVTESTRGPKSGDNVELLGSYNPHADSATLNGERILHWISKGAQVSDTVHNLLINQKIIDGKKRNALPKKTPIVKEAPAEEAPEATEEVKAKTSEAGSSDQPVADVVEEVKVEEEAVAPAEVEVEEKKEEKAKTSEAGSPDQS